MAGAADKAKAAKKAVAKGTLAKGNTKVRTSMRFHRPKTLKLARKPLYPRRAVERRQRMDAHSIIRYPCTTENAMQKIENDQTLTFFVHKRANKNQIKAVAKKMFDIEIVKVNTLITPKGEKKAFIVLPRDKEFGAVDIANRLGVI